VYIILLEVGRELSSFCKMAHRSKVVGPRWSRVFGYFQLFLNMLAKQ